MSVTRKRRLVLISSVVLGLTLVATGCSSGAPRSTSGQTTEFLYWADHNNGTIGRARLDGKEVRPSFISHAGVTPCNIAVGGGYIFWGSDGAQGIGRADLNGTHVEVSFIKYTVTSPVACGVAVSGNYLYWADDNDGSIGRAKLDGTDVDSNFISGASNAGFITVTNQYLYWGNAGPASAGTTIGRARLDGSGATQDFLSAPGVSALVVQGNQLYWANDASLVTGTINVATLDGSQPNRTFIHDSKHIGAPFGFVIAPGT